MSVTMNEDEPVGGSPFVCNIYDVSKVLVTGLGSSKVEVICIEGDMFSYLKICSQILGRAIYHIHRGCVSSR